MPVLPKMLVCKEIMNVPENCRKGGGGGRERVVGTLGMGKRGDTSVLENCGSGGRCSLSLGEVRTTNVPEN